MGYESATATVVTEIRREGMIDILSITPTATHGNKIKFDAGMWVEVANGSGAPVTVTAHVSRVIDNQTVPDRAIAIAAGARKKIGPFTSDYRQADGYVWLTFSAVADVTLAAFRVRRYLYDDVYDEIYKWQANPGYIHHAGKPESSWSHVTYVGDDTTYIITEYACRRNGAIRRVVCHAHTSTAAWKLRLYRWDSGGGVYEMVVGSERLITPTTGDVDSTIDIIPPIECKVGDIPGIYFPAGNLLWEDVTSVNLNKRYASGDQISNAFADVNGGSFAFACYGSRPYLAIAGDSIASGGNAGDGNQWYPYVHNAPPASNCKSFPGGTYTSEIWRGVSDLIDGNTIFSWQNAGLSGEEFDYGVSTGVPNALSSIPHTLIVAFGTNDITSGETWANTETRLNAIKTLFDASDSQRLILCEILPRTDASDIQAAAIRTFNANFAVWSAANGVTLAVLHDAMGKLRVSTGELDDLADAYNQDGVHLTTAGVAKYAELIEPYLT